MDHFAGQLVEVFEELLGTIQEPIGPMLDDEHSNIGDISKKHKKHVTSCNNIIFVSATCTGTNATTNHKQKVQST